MEPFQSVAMTAHPCYTFYQRMSQCQKAEEMNSRMCFRETEDWYECKTRRKARAFQNFIQTEMNRTEIMSLPVYDQSTDSFKDGPLPKNVDGYFSKPEQFRQYYNWIIADFVGKYSVQLEHKNWLRSAILIEIKRIE